MLSRQCNGVILACLSPSDLALEPNGNVSSELLIVFKIVILNVQMLTTRVVYVGGRQLPDLVKTMISFRLPS